MDTFLNDMYWAIAVIFSVVFAWQLLAALFGHIGAGAESTDMAGGHDVVGGHDVAGGHDAGGAGHDAGAVHGADSIASFKLLSIRSVTAFGLLFGWAGVLYMRNLEPGESVNWAILKSVLWGGLGMVLVSLMFYFFTRLTETGTRRIASCVGERATVYMDIPAAGAGQIRAIVSGAVTNVAARSVGGTALKAGTPVMVKRVLDSYTVEVEKVD